MTTQGVVVIDGLGLALAMLIVNLVRTHQLYVGYALMWLFSIIAVMLTVSIPQLLDLVTVVVGAVFPVSALSLIAFAFIMLVLIFLSVQVSTISARQAELIQALALNALLDQDTHASSERQEHAS